MQDSYFQIFLSGLPSFYKKKIQYDKPMNLEETIRRVKHINEHIMERLVFKKFGMIR
jgi:hypothetical protein